MSKEDNHYFNYYKLYDENKLLYSLVPRTIPLNGSTLLCKFIKMKESKCYLWPIECNVNFLNFIF